MRKRKKRPKKKPRRTKPLRKKPSRTRLRRKKPLRKRKNWTRRKLLIMPRPTRISVSKNKPGKRPRIRLTQPWPRLCARNKCNACKAWPGHRAARTPRELHSNRQGPRPVMRDDSWAASNPTSPTPAT